MRLLIIGGLKGHITAATRIVMARGAKVQLADSIESGLASLRSGHSAELVMVDIELDIARLVQSLAAERIAIPVVACGLHTSAEAAVAAIKAGAKEYVPLPPDPALIAAVLEAVAEESDMTMPRFLKIITHRGGKSAGAVRVSLGVASNFADVLKFCEFAKGLRDQTRLTMGDVTFDIESCRVIRDGS